MRHRNSRTRTERCSGNPPIRTRIAGGRSAHTCPPCLPSSEAETLVPGSPLGEELPQLGASTFVVDWAAGILGHYRNVQPLRPWKSGTIYSAIHDRLNRRVELQVLEVHDQAGGLSSEPDRRQAFLEAARGRAVIQHPNVETGVMEAGTHGNVTFVAREWSELELLDGFGPRNRAERRREPLFPNGKLAQALLYTANGLAEIHRAGLCHGHITRAYFCVVDSKVKPALLVWESSQQAKRFSQWRPAMSQAFFARKIFSILAMRSRNWSPVLLPISLANGARSRDNSAVSIQVYSPPR